MISNRPSELSGTASPPAIIGVIVGYGSLPDSLRDAALAIVSQPEALEAVSSVSRRAEGLDEKLENIATRHPEELLMLFTDLYGSSCSLGGLNFCVRHPGTAVLCGVNLAMLIRFLYYRQRLGYRELADFLLRTGQEEIRQAGNILPR